MKHIIVSICNRYIHLHACMPTKTSVKSTHHMSGTKIRVLVDFSICTAPKGNCACNTYQFPCAANY